MASSRWISSMNRISRCSSAVSSAARSPARSMIGPGGGLDRHLQLGGDHVREAGLAHAGRPEEQHVVERFAAAARGLDRHAQVRDHLRLADVLVEPARAQRLIEAERRRRAGRAETRRGSIVRAR